MSIGRDRLDGSRDLASMLSTAPALARPELAAERLSAWLDGVGAGRRASVSAPATSALLLALADHSPHLWRLATADDGRLVDLLSRPPGESLDLAIDRMVAGCADASDASGAMPALRRAKATVSLLVAMADLGGAWDLEAVTGAMTTFADRAVSSAVDALLREAVGSGALAPGGDLAGGGSGLAVLALGKGGAGELNYSSDVDLVAFYDPGAARIAPSTVPAKFYTRMVQGLVRLLGERTGDGYALRVDLRLRPDPGSTSVAVSLPAAFHYYETLGQTWERAAFIKARPVAGDLALGARFLADLSPFVWRRYFDYGAIAEVHAMKRQVHAFRGHGAVAVPGHDVKLGRGGIREVEFFAQTQQLVFGGRRPGLRGARTLEVLPALAAEGWIGPDAVADLSGAYRLLRKVEHRLQMVADEQTQRLPTDEGELASFALFAGFDDRASFDAAMLSAMRAVEAHYAALFERAGESEGAADVLTFTGASCDPGTVEAFGRLGFRRPEHAVETVRGWFFGRRPAVRSGLAREALSDLAPVLVDAFARSGDPDAALAGFDALLGRLPAAVELFGLLRSNAALRQLLADLLGVAPRLARTVAARPHLLDAAIDPATRAEPPPGRVAALVSGQASAGGDGREAVLDRAREVAREHAFVIGVQLLSGIVAPGRAAAMYSDLASEVLRALLERVEGDIASEHGRVPGGAVAVLGMGKLGSREMTATSDLDLVLVYDHDPEGGESDGRRPLVAQRYYARLAQRLVSALTTATRAGQLYDVDMRLRPSGTQGPVAVGFRAFARYHAEDAETWERMALTRARVVAGDAGLADRVASVARASLTRRPGEALGSEVAALRDLVRREKPHAGPWDLKLAPGGQLDLEFIAQYLVLRHAHAHPGLLGLTTTETFRVARELGVVALGEADALVAASTLHTDLTQVLRLTTEGRFDPDHAGEGLSRRLAAAAGLPSFDALERHLADAQADARRIFASILSRCARQEASDPTA